MYAKQKVRHYQIELGDVSPTVVLSDFGDEVDFGVSFTVQNIDTSATVYIGDSSVSSSNFGMRLAPGAVATFEDMPRYPEIYAISDTADSKIAVMRISK